MKQQAESLSCVSRWGMGSTVVAIALAASSAWGISKNYPWDRKTRFEPDNQVPGSFVNLGQTGARAKLDARSLEVRYVFKGTPADGKLKVGDVIVGAGGKAFETPHKFGWGYKNCGGEGPLMDLGGAIEAAEGADGMLRLTVRRDGKARPVTLKLRTIGKFSPTYPARCARSDLLFRELCDYLAGRQRPDGSWQGDWIVTSAAGLVLLGSGEAKYAGNVRRAVERQMKIQPYARGLHNWRLTYSGVFLAEYYLATGDERVIPALKRIQWGMVRNLSPNGATQHLKVGDVDWGGYNELSIMSGQMMIAWGLIERCGVAIDRGRLDAVHEFLTAITCRNGYVCYNRREFYDLHGMNNADFGRTGAAALGHWLCDRDGTYDAYVRHTAKYIADYPKWFPDTHGSGGVGMMWSALGVAVGNPRGFRRLMDYHRWWFTLAWCGDGSFVTQPTRSGAVGADYWALPREWMTAVVGLILARKERKLRICGGRFIEGVEEGKLAPKTRAVLEDLHRRRYAKALAALEQLRPGGGEKKAAAAMKRYILRRARAAAGELAALDEAGDPCKFLERLPEAKEHFGGIADFDRRVQPIETALAKEPKASQVEVGREYYRILDAIRQPLSLASVRALERFAERHKPSPYAHLARRAVRRLWQIGIHLVPMADHQQQTWRYTTDKPPKDWSRASFDDSKWKAGPTGFGHRPTVQGVVRTPWKTSDIYLRRTFRLESIPEELLLTIYYDDTVAVYVNGVLALKSDKRKSVYTPTRIGKEARAVLKKGVNVLAVHCGNADGRQYIDLGILGRDKPRTNQEN